MKMDTLLRVRYELELAWQMVSGARVTWSVKVSPMAGSIRIRRYSGENVS